MFGCYWLHNVHKASHISNIESTVCLSRKAKMVNNGGLTSMKIPFHNSLDSLKPLLADEFDATQEELNNEMLRHIYAVNKAGSSARSLKFGEICVEKGAGI